MSKRVDDAFVFDSDPDRQRLRWLYFVREYLQPLKSRTPENTITIIASHGNLLTSFDFIVDSFLRQNVPLESFPKVRLPVGTGILHAQTLQYRSVGSQMIYLVTMFLMNEIQT